MQLPRERMNLELLGIRQSYHYTAVMVTHSISEAVFLADRVLVLSHRPGRVVNEIVIGLRKPRTLDLMGSPEFGLLTQELRSAIDPQTSLKQHRELGATAGKSNPPVL